MGAFFYVLDGHELELRFHPFAGAEVFLDGRSMGRKRWFGGVRFHFEGPDKSAWDVKVRQWFHTTNVSIARDGKALVGWRP